MNLALYRRLQNVRMQNLNCVPYMEGSIVLCISEHLHHRIYFTVANILQSPVRFGDPKLVYGISDETSRDGAHISV